METYLQIIQHVLANVLINVKMEYKWHQILVAAEDVICVQRQVVELFQLILLYAPANVLQLVHQITY